MITQDSSHGCKDGLIYKINGNNKPYKNTQGLTLSKYVILTTKTFVKKEKIAEGEGDNPANEVHAFYV